MRQGFRDANPGTHVRGELAALLIATEPPHRAAALARPG
jgi:hypothetical protein